MGQASNLSNRTATHRQQLRKGSHYNTHLQRAFDKYGESEFSVAYLMHCEVTELTWYEQRILDMYQRRGKVFNNAAPVDTPMLGAKREYNSASIDALNNNRKLAHAALAEKRSTDPEYKDFMSKVGRASMARLRADPIVEAKRKINAATAQRCPKLAKVRQAHILRRFAEGWKPKRNSKTVFIINTNTGVIYESYTKAAIEFGVAVPTIHKWVNGRTDGRAKNNSGKPNWRLYDKENL